MLMWGLGGAPHRSPSGSGRRLGSRSGRGRSWRSGTFVGCLHGRGTYRHSLRLAIAVCVDAYAQRAKEPKVGVRHRITAPPPMVQLPLSSATNGSLVGYFREPQSTKGSGKVVNGQ